MSPPSRGLGGRLGGDQVGVAGRWVSSNRTWLRVLVALVGVVVLLWGNQVSMERFWWSLATVVLGLVAVQVLVGAGEEATAVDTRHRGDAIPVEAT